jgi:sugar phosphate isomerase/epimerase
MADQLALGLMTGMSGEPLAALQAVKELGIPTVQLSYPAHLDTPEGIEKIKSAVEETGVEITTVFCSFGGESYKDIPTVRATVGLVPESTRVVRVAKIEEISVFAQKLGVHRVAAHIGFIPEDENDPRYPALLETVQKICDDLKARDQVFALETGQETAKTLRRFIDDLKRDNIRVNFDPANMILYGNDNPIEALDLLVDWIDGVHCKDGNWPTEEQKAQDKLGHETPLGEGAVNIPEWIKKLLSLGFTGPLTIEREISGEEQKRDILKGKELILENINKHRLC